MVGWFEIPVEDMERASKFYEEVFDISISVHDLDGIIMGWFSGIQGKTGSSGSLVKHEMYIPGDSAGPLLYFSCKDLAMELAKVTIGAGSIIQQKKEIGGGHGFMALLTDTEGNRMALPSLQ